LGDWRHGQRRKVVIAVDHPFANADAAARKLVEIANAF
jgi:hypothetical protein